MPIEADPHARSDRRAGLRLTYSGGSRLSTAPRPTDKSSARELRIRRSQGRGMRSAQSSQHDEPVLASGAGLMDWPLRCCWHGAGCPARDGGGLNRTSPGSRAIRLSVTHLSTFDRIGCAAPMLTERPPGRYAVRPFSALREPLDPVAHCANGFTSAIRSACLTHCVNGLSSACRWTCLGHLGVELSLPLDLSGHLGVELSELLDLFGHLGDRAELGELLSLSGHLHDWMELRQPFGVPGPLTKG